MDAQQGGSGLLGQSVFAECHGARSESQLSGLLQLLDQSQPPSTNFASGSRTFRRMTDSPSRGAPRFLSSDCRASISASIPPARPFPTFSFSDGSFSSIGQDRTGTTISQTMQFTDNFSHTVKNHTLRFRRRCAPRTLQRADVLPAFGRLRRFHLQPRPVHATMRLAIFYWVCRRNLFSPSPARRSMRKPRNGAFTCRTSGRRAAA